VVHGRENKMAGLDLVRAGARRINKIWYVVLDRDDKVEQYFFGIDASLGSSKTWLVRYI